MPHSFNHKQHSSPESSVIDLRYSNYFHKSKIKIGYFCSKSTVKIESELLDLTLKEMLQSKSSKRFKTWKKECTTKNGLCCLYTRKEFVGLEKTLPVTT